MILQEGLSWLNTMALPLWAERGFDPSRRAFEEQLDFLGSPVRTIPLRALVQARQIAVFAAAGLSGRYPRGEDLALQAAHAMVESYLNKGGAPGWVFSIDRVGKVVDSRRDLYTHAFVLFALAWILRVRFEPVLAEAVYQTLQVLDTAFSDPKNGGFWDSLPRPDRLRRQNPHMHLFEALMELHLSDERFGALARCNKLKDLAVSRLINVQRGSLCEYYDDAWTIEPKPGFGIVEPGHLFEWAWLLRRYESIAGKDLDAHIKPLLKSAIDHGLTKSNGRIIDEMDETGMPRLTSSRSWPHAEAIKALSMESVRGDAGAANLLPPVVDRLMQKYCREDLGGGWIDWLDADDQPRSIVMPASSFYHLYFAFTSKETPGVEA